MRLFQRATAVVALLVSATGVQVVQGGPAQAALPTAAVALGDSFVSGEGAGNYQPVVDDSGTAQGFPGWSAANSNAYFCHRSANASVFAASLPGIQQRFNLACSGAQPADIAAPASARPEGRTVASQLDQLRAVAQSYDIDVVLVGLGSNNTQFTFGDVATLCANRFIADAWTGWWEFWAYLKGEVPQRPCTASDLATGAEVAAATVETTAALRQILDTLDQVDADGSHQVILQTYTNPLPPELASQYHEEDNRSDTRDKFRALGAERYAAGCPIHRASLAPGQVFSESLGSLVKNARATLAAERPAADVRVLDVQRAFDGARLCENPGSPDGALATPVRVQDGPSGTFITSLSGWDKIGIQRAANTCVTYFQTCQESWHPNAAGHSVLGQCLAGAVAAAPRSVVTCARNANGSLTVS
jgi:lysophospholipase L1-like esterase